MPHEGVAVRARLRELGIRLRGSQLWFTVTIGRSHKEEEANAELGTSWNLLLKI